MDELYEGGSDLTNSHVLDTFRQDCSKYMDAIIKGQQWRLRESA